MTRRVAAWMLLIPLGALGAGIDSGSALASGEPDVRRTRQYEVREDEETGRLVRVAGRSRKSLRSNGQGTAKPRHTVVQGRSGSPAPTETGEGLSIEALVEQAARRYEVSPELIRAVMRHESNYNPYAVSHKGAQGLMQLMPHTARKLGVKDILDPAENVEGGAKLLRQLLDHYEGDAELTLAAYNAGAGAVERYGGVPPYAETETYVARVRRTLGSTERSESDETSSSEWTAAGPRIVARVDSSGAILFETARD